MAEERGGSRSSIPSPFLFAGFLAAGLVLDRLSPFSQTANVVPARLGIVAATGGVAIVAAASARTSTQTLVTDGLFRYTRNPMIFGLTSIYLGVAMARRSLPALILLPIALALTDRYVVDPEERALANAFGDDYRAFQARTPRWF